MTLQHFHCDQCHEYMSQEVFTHDNGIPITSGYGTNDRGEKVCYGCCTKNDRESMVMAHASNKPFYAYVDGAGCNIVNWPGCKLGAIFRYHESRVGWHRSRSARFLAKDIAGKWWKGRGVGCGMYCTLRPCAKRPKSIRTIEGN